MRFFNDRKLLTKLAVPIALLVLVTLGVLVLAKHDLDTLAASTAEIVDVRAARRALVPELGMALNDVSVFEKVVILETREEQARVYAARYAKAKADALAATDRLAAINSAWETIEASRIRARA